MANEFGVYMRALRGSRTLREIAKLTGLSYTYIRDLELGHHRANGKPVHPKIDVLNKIATAFNIPLEILTHKANITDPVDSDKIQKILADPQEIDKELLEQYSIERFEILRKYRDLLNAFEQLDKDAQRHFIAMMKLYQRK